MMMMKPVFRFVSVVILLFYASQISQSCIFAVGILKFPSKGYSMLFTCENAVISANKGCLELQTEYTRKSVIGP